MYVTTPPLSPQIEDIALVYHRPDDSEQKYLDLDGEMEELMVDYSLVCDRSATLLLPDPSICPPSP